MPRLWSEFSIAPEHHESVKRRLKDNSAIDHNGCWAWLRSGRGTGYGAIKVAGKAIDTHRASYAVFKGAIPADLVVMHTCDNRLCVNPDHLELGTLATNHQDAVAKGRVKPFRVQRDEPLSDNELAELVDRFKRGVSQRALVKQFNVAPTTLKRLLRAANVL